MTATLERRRARPVGVRTHTRAGRTGYLIGALCIAIATVMLLPLVASLLASVKPTAEAAASPPTYLPHALSLDSYQRLAKDFAHGLPGHFIGNIEGVEVYHIPGIALGFGNYPFVRPNLGLPR